MRIVIVEDEKRAARGLRSLLERISADYTIVGEAPDGISAFELIKKKKSSRTWSLRISGCSLWMALP